MTEPLFTIFTSYTSPQGKRQYQDKIYVDFFEIGETLKKVKQDKNKGSSKSQERKKVSYSLRYDIMRRDEFKCVLCGRSQKDGVKLEVDHIKPISKGGKTEWSNLRTLCKDCNRGKRDKYNENGFN